MTLTTKVPFATDLYVGSEPSSLAVQAVLSSWASAPGPQDDIALLAKSYEALPSDAHRRMFLDAALL